ncbi:MAG: hypothetical protein GF364_05000 [Candidatus Lokiarchaeota archaeon]|nr:hypothetical protein [Candidatus Lokiarchaeota archaeon]
MITIRVNKTVLYYDLEQCHNQAVAIHERIKILVDGLEDKIHRHGLALQAIRAALYRDGIELKNQSDAELLEIARSRIDGLMTVLDVPRKAAESEGENNEK